MNTLTIDNIEYVLSDYILKNAPIYSKGARSSRDLMRRKKISKDDFIFMKLKGDKYIKSDGKSIKLDKLFVKKSIIDIIPELNNEKGVTDDGIEEAPEIIELKDSEKFFDNKGNPLEIETRGERTEEGIYFKVKDVEKAFDIKCLCNNILKDHTSYKKNIDYKFFICKNYDNVLFKTNKDMYLTYEGILRVLYVSRNNKTTSFRKWATKSLFTLQMGTKEQKKELFDKHLGFDIKETRKLIKSNTGKISVVYLLSLGYAKDLKQYMKIPEGYSDDAIIFKYGLTNNFSERLRQHQKTFSEFNVKSKFFSYIDEKLLSDAETYVKHSFDFNGCNVEYKDFTELFVLEKNKIKLMQSVFTNLTNIFGGDQSYYIQKLEAQKEMYQKEYIQRELVHTQEISELKLELVKSKAERDVAVKDKEIAELKLLLATK